LTWDSRRDPGSRVLGIWLLKPNFSSKQVSFQAVEEPIERVAGGRKYKIVTREYMAQGHDGFSMLTRGQLLIDHESGAIMSSIVRKYMLGRVDIFPMSNDFLNATIGSQFVNKVIRLKERHTVHKERTRAAIDLQEQKLEEFKPAISAAARRWERAMWLVHQAMHYRDHMAICTSEHMTTVDAFDGHNTRKGRSCNKVSLETNPDLVVVSPAVDGRLKDEGRENSGE
jgi:5'-nucleotidase